MDYVVIGDSHAQTCFESRGVNIGPRTAHNLQNYDEDVKKKIDKNRKWIFNFGEIDCRIHIYLKAEGNPEWILNGCFMTAKRYIWYINELIKQGYDIDVLSIVPTGEIDNRKNWPFYGTVEEREFITMTLNLMIGFLCYKSEIVFYDLYPHLIDKDGYRRKDLILDEVHLKNKVAGIFDEIILGQQNR